jgi:hypothetical protein
MEQIHEIINKKIKNNPIDKRKQLKLFENIHPLSYCTNEEEVKIIPDNRNTFSNEISLRISKNLTICYIICIHY